jgi:RNA recognition motif-containing protein
MSAKIYVGNLSWNTTDDTLREAFGAYGQIADSIVMRDRETGRSRGFGFVTYNRGEEAEAAINGMNDQELDGRRIRVNIANVRGSGGSGGGGGGGYTGGGYTGGSFSGGAAGNYPAGYPQGGQTGGQPQPAYNAQAAYSAGFTYPQQGGYQQGGYQQGYPQGGYQQPGYQQGGFSGY